jgi:hypothetical protein
MATSKKAQTGKKVTPVKTTKKVKITLPKEKVGNPFDRTYPTTERFRPAQLGKKVMPKKVAPKKPASTGGGSKMNSLFPGFTTPTDPRKGGVSSEMSRNGKSIKKKMQNGGSLSGRSASNKRDKGIDPKGAWTQVQQKAISGAKGKASLTKDKQLGATKMKMGGKMKKC